jgi:propanediol dehydratase small subunit
MKYPLYKKARDQIELPSSKSIKEFNLENLESGALTSADLGIHRKVLLTQALIAEESGFPQLAENLRRASELTQLPDDELLRIYEALRPGRMDRESLYQLARKVEDEYGASLTARFIREAATIAAM